MFESFKMSQARNDFSLTVSDRDWKEEWITIFSAQTSKVRVNLIKCELVMGVRQLRSGIIQDALFHLLTKDGKTIDSIRIKPSKSKDKGAEYVFVDGTMTNHEYDLDYDSKESILHEVTFKFKRVNLYSSGASEPIVYYPDGKKEKNVLME